MTNERGVTPEVGRSCVSPGKPSALPSILVMWTCKPRVRVAPQPAMRCRERKYEEAGDHSARHSRSRWHGKGSVYAVGLVLAEGYIGPHSGAADGSLTAPPCDRSASIHIWLTQEETAL